MTRKPRVFLSYSHEDKIRAADVRAALDRGGLDCVRDVDHLRPGDSLISFMESSLRTSDSCVLLWSRCAERSPWVRAEWESALHKAIRSARSFLVVGRLHDHPLPELLHPRLSVDLFPQLSPGVEQLIDLHRRDEKVASTAGRPVAGHDDLETRTGAGCTVYVISSLFQFALPVHVDLNEPQGVLLGRLTESLNLPQTWSHERGLGVRFAYRLVHKGQPLAGSSPLTQEGVEVGALLELELEMQPFSSIPPRSGSLTSAVFRRAAVPADEVEPLARAYLQDRLAAQGLVDDSKDARR